MRANTRGHLLWSVCCSLWCAGLMHARTQQTFVVRYKNGEHTVPVTVVLDYKKQTEYVINMSPRATTKTVTLYDFKQKTIAYKDLTNRECFLGRLTHETLHEETDALAKIHNPVERQPKVLSLDPHRTSLTPTEIRNVAGQKTAVFCGKMNTWLVLPSEAHSVRKREVDEIDERTFHRHGYHTVRYSHFGRETRRRYRNPASRHRFQGSTGNSSVPNWKAGNSGPANENGARQFEYPSFPPQLLNPSHLKTDLNGNNREIHHPDIPVINGKDEFHSASNHPVSWNSRQTASSASQPNGFKNELRPASNHPANLISGGTASSISQPNGLSNGFHPALNHPESWNSGKTDSSSYQTNGLNNEFQFPSNHPGNWNSGKTASSDSLPNGLSNEFGLASNHADSWKSGNIASSALIPDGLTNEHEVQFPFYPAAIETPNYGSHIVDFGDSNDKRDSQGKLFSNLKETNTVNDTFASKPNLEVAENKNDQNPQNRQNHAFHLNGDPRQNGVEDESIPHGYDLNADRKKLYPNEHVFLEDPDVSSNVLEIPKVTKKFENIDNSLQPPPITQTNEDVHDIFEGFFNLRKSDPPSEQLNYNSNFIPGEPNGGRERNYPDDSLTSGYPSFSHTRINSEANRNQQWRENEPNGSKISDVIETTDPPSLTTNAYSNYSGVTISPTYWNGFSDSKPFGTKPENWDNLNSTSQRVGHSSRLRTVEVSQPVSPKDENILNEAVDEYFTTGNPLYTSTDKKYIDQRSDVSIEGNLKENFETFTPSSFDRNLQETTERQNIFHSGVPEGISSQQIRFQNVLRNYKPDEIVIDVEKIPTQRPPESTLGFQGQVFSPNSNISPNLTRNANGPKSEQTSGGTFRGRPIRKPNHPSRKIHNFQPGGFSFGARKPPQSRGNESNISQHRVHDNNIRQLVYPSPRTLQPHPLYNTPRLYRLDNLPPGVSIHPRHPKAPYADAVHSNVLPPVAPYERAPKLHRQRHHKKKDRLMNTCCRTRGRTKSCCGSCCRSKSLHANPSCCPSTKPGKNELRPKQVLAASVPAPLRPKQVLTASVPAPLRPKQVRTASVPAPLRPKQVRTASVPVVPAPQQVRKPVEDPRNRCQKEKLCRTLYESTQQVMVCRHAKIEGC